MQIIGGLSKVSVDGVTVTGQGTPSSPLVSSPGMPSGWPLQYWGSGNSGAGTPQHFATPANTLTLLGFAFDEQVKFNKIFIYVGAADSVNLYDIGIYTYAGVLVAHIGAQSIPSTAVQSFAMIGGPITLPPGRYFLAFTGNSVTGTAILATGNVTGWSFQSQTGFGTSVGGALPSTITPPADANVLTNTPVFALSI